MEWRWLRGYDLGMKFLKIIGLAIAAAVVYGLIYGEIAIRVSPLYFAELHPRVASQSRTLIAPAWEFVATWWAVLIMGVLLGLSARVGREPKVEPRALVRPITVLLVAMALGATLAGYWQFRRGSIIDGNITPDQGARWFAVEMASSYSCALGFLGSFFLCVWTLLRRWRMSRTLRQGATV